LSQLLWNLVMNAIQHGRAKCVEVRVEQTNGQVRIGVHNGGLPIPREAMANLFNPLRLEGAAEQHRVGLGLGLFICNEIVKAHEGTITAVSTADAGTTFAVQLNRRAADQES
jgi:signal transduction histidine kinase